MAEKDIRFRLRIRKSGDKSIGDLRREFDRTGKSAKKAGKDLAAWNERVGKTTQRVGRLATTIAARLGMILGAGALIRLTKSVVQIGAEFEKTMAIVGGVTRATAREFDLMEAQARRLGETTEWTASQAAEGLKFLGMAGFEAAQATAALPAVLDLATAGNIDLGRAADIASNALTAMRLPVSELTRINDVFIRTITTSNTNMEMMAESFKYAAPLAAAYGFEIEELATYIGLLGNAGIQGCYDEETEVLTIEGWKYWSEVTMEDTFATVNPKTRAIEYNKPIAIIAYEYDGEMYQVQNRNVNLLVTPNHNMYVSFYRSTNDKDFALHRADSVLGRPVRYVASFEWKGREVAEKVLEGFIQDRGSWTKEIAPLPIKAKDFAEFLGYYLAEGSCDYRKGSYRIRITQKNKKGRKLIRKCLEKLPFHFREEEDGFVILSQQLYNYVSLLGKSGEKFIPAEIKAWSKELLEVLYQALVVGDGDENGAVYTCSKQLSDDIQEICLKAGYAVSESVSSKKGDKKGKINGRWVIATRNTYKINVRSNQLAPAYCQDEYKGKHGDRLTGTVAKPKEGMVEYKGMVYCAEVPPNHILIVRRGGKVVACGNSMAGTQLAMSFQQLPKAFKAFGRESLDAEGNVRSLVEAIKMLEDVAATAPEIMEVFGQRSGRAVLALLGQGSYAIEKYNEKIKDNKDAAIDLATTMRDTITGAFLELASAVEGVKIDTFEDYMDSLKKIIKESTVWIREHKEEIKDLADFMVRGFTKNIEMIKGLYTTWELLSKSMGVEGKLWGFINDNPLILQMGLIGLLLFGSGPGRLIYATLGVLFAVVADGADQFSKLLGLVAAGRISMEDFLEVFLAGGDNIQRAKDMLKDFDTDPSMELSNAKKGVVELTEKYEALRKEMESLPEGYTPIHFGPESMIFGAVRKRDTPLDVLAKGLENAKARVKELTAELDGTAQAAREAATATLEVEEKAKQAHRDEIEAFEAKLTQWHRIERAQQRAVDFYDKVKDLAIVQRAEEQVIFEESMKQYFSLLKAKEEHGEEHYNTLLSMVMNSYNKMQEEQKKFNKEGLIADTNKWDAERALLDLRAAEMTRFIEGNKALMKALPNLLKEYLESVARMRTAIDAKEKTDDEKRAARTLRAAQTLASKQLAAMKSMYGDMSNLREDDTSLAIGMLADQYNTYAVLVEDKVLLSKWFNNELEKIWDNQKVKYGSMLDSMGIAYKEWVEDSKSYSELAYDHMKELFDKIDSGFADVFEGFFKGEIDNFKDFVDEMLDIFGRMLAEMAAKALVSNIIIPMGQSFVGSFMGEAGRETLSNLLGTAAATTTGAGVANWLGAGAGAAGMGTGATAAGTWQKTGYGLEYVPGTVGAEATGITKALGKVGDTLGKIAPYLGAAVSGYGAYTALEEQDYAAAVYRGANAAMYLIPGMQPVAVVMSILDALGITEMLPGPGAKQPSIRGEFGVSPAVGFDILSRPDLLKEAVFNYADQYRPEMAESVIEAMDDTIGETVRNISEWLNDLVSEGIIKPEDIPKDFLEDVLSKTSIVLGLKEYPDKFSQMVADRLEEWQDAIIAAATPFIVDSLGKSLEASYKELNIDRLIKDHPITRLYEALIGGSENFETLEAFIESFNNFSQALMEIDAVWNDITTSVEELIDPLSTVERELKQVGNQFDEWIGILRQLGYAESAIFQVEKQRLRVLKGIRLDYIDSLLERLDDLQYGGDRSIETLRTEFQSIAAEFAALNKNDEDYYSSALSLLEQQLDIASDIARYTEQQVALADNTIKSIDDMLLVMSPVGKLGAGQSIEAFQERYDKLMGIMGTGTPEERLQASQDLSAFLPDYLNFMQAYGISHAETIDKVRADLEEIKFDVLASKADILGISLEGLGEDILGLPVDELNSYLNSLATESGLLTVEFSLLRTELESFREEAEKMDAYPASVAASVEALGALAAIDWDLMMTDYAAALLDQPKLTWDQFITGIGTGAEGSKPWSDYITDPVWADVITSPDWTPMLTKNLDWGFLATGYGIISDAFPTMDWATFVGGIDWAAYATSIQAITAAGGTFDWGALVTAFDLALTSIPDLTWDTWIGKVDWGDYIKGDELANTVAEGVAVGISTGLYDDPRERFRLIDQYYADKGKYLYARGGRVTQPSIAGEAGPEWIVPVAGSPYNEEFLRSVGANPEAIAAAIVAQITSVSGENGSAEIHVHVHLDETEIAYGIGRQIRAGNVELIDPIRELSE